MQSGIVQLQLRFDAVRANDTEVVSESLELVQEDCLADARLPPNDERGAPSGPSPVNDVPKLLELGASAH